MKKVKLPKNWVVVNSKSHPDRVYYFNIKNNKSSWTVPTEDDANKSSDNEAQKPKKRKKCDEESLKKRATTPELEEADIIKNSGRRTLLAKRRSETVLSAKRYSEPAQERDTPVMAEIRKKMLERKNNINSKNNSPANSKCSNKYSLQKNVVLPNSPEKKTSTAAKSDIHEKNTKTEIMTPQMKAIYEKMQQKNIKKNLPKQSEMSHTSKDTVETDSITSMQKLNQSRSMRLKSRGRTNEEDENVKSPLSQSNAEAISSKRLDLTRNMSRDKDDSSSKYSQAAENTERKNNVANRGGRIMKKNIAHDRLDKLKKTLQAKDQKINKLVQNCDKSLLKIMNNNESIDIYKTADVRYKNLRTRLLRNKAILQTHEILSTAKTNTQSATSDVSNDFAQEANNTSVYEEMDWEPLEDEKITFEVQAARMQLGIENIRRQTLPVAKNILQISPSAVQEEKKTLYIVVDTNVFLSNIEAIEKARDIQFETYNRPILVIPWTIIRELDYIKDDKSRVRSEHLRAKARKAVNFLNDHFSAKHPRIVGQTPEDVANNKERFAVECPDDEILQTCLQIRDAGRAVALLSYDKNLCNKAMIYDILALGRDDPLEKIDYVSSTSNTNINFHDIYFQGTEGRKSEVLSPFQEELRFSDDLYQDVQSIIKESLSVIVSKEMRNLYGDTWEKYSIIKPPWTTVCVLKCAVKHWIAAVSEAFDRRAEPVLKELLEIFSQMSKSSNKLKDIAYLLEKCSDLMQLIKVDKYPQLMARASNAIDELRKKCQHCMNEIREKKLQDEIGKEENIIEQKHRAEKAFKYFDDIYGYARDICGMAANIVGMPCSFCYQTPNPAPSIEYVKRIQPDVAANVHHLLRVLSTALEQMQNSCIDHQALLDLYHTLTAFLPERFTLIDSDLSPLDVYCCLKQKEDVLKTGIQQLQELSAHFCRLATYRCT